MKILMVSGFLGAGKTTFIMEMAQKVSRDFVVLENEYGHTDIDSQLIRSEADMEVYELTQGCVCCSMKQDFATSVLTIANTLDPEILIVEPTGVARLSNLMNNVNRIAYERIELLQPITMVDGLVFDKQLARADDIYLDQIRHASTIIVTKVAHTNPEITAPIEARLRSINPEAEIVMDSYAQRDASWFSGLLNRYADGRVVISDNNEEADLETVTLHDAALDSPAKLIAFLDAVAFGVFGQVLRAKGYLPCADAWLRFDMVDGVWGITGFEGEAPKASEVVFIGSDLKRNCLREVLLPAFRS